jgi:predicted TIM-barrel fold metal-dependent hydrolase
MFHRQCYLTTWYNQIAVHARHIGTNNILWATNFPAADSTWPASRGFREKCFAGVNDGDQRRIAWGNAAKLYRIERNSKEPAP